MPGSTPPTSQLDWLISMTTMIVLFWSRATRDLLKACPGEGRGRSAGASRHSIVKCSDEVAMSLYLWGALGWICRKLARRADPPGATVPFPVLEAPRRDMCPGGLATADAP